MDLPHTEINNIIVSELSRSKIQISVKLRIEVVLTLKIHDNEDYYWEMTDNGNE